MKWLGSKRKAASAGEGVAGNRFYRLWEVVHLLWTFILGVGLLVGSHFVSKDLVEGLFRELCRDIGIGVLVGGYVSVTIERRSRLKIQEDIEKYIRVLGDNFLSAVYGRRLPMELFEVVRRSVFEQSFVRRGYHCDIRLRNFTEECVRSSPGNIRGLLESFRRDSVLRLPEQVRSNLVLMEVSNRYEVWNVSGAACNHELSFAVGNPFGGKFAGICGLTNARVDNRPLLPCNPYIETRAGIRDDPTMVSFKAIVEIPASEKVSVEIDSYSVQSNERDDAWWLTMLTQGVEFTVLDHNGDKEISLSLMTVPSGKRDWFTSKNENTNKATIQTDQFLLPFQGIQINWRPAPKTNKIVSG